MNTDLDRHLVVVSTDGSFTPSGQRLTGPVSAVDKLHTLIDWARRRDLLQPIPDPTGHEPALGRVWVIGSAWAALAGLDPDAAAGIPAGDVPGAVAGALGIFASAGWELRGHPGGRFTLSRGEGEQRWGVEILVEAQPWLAEGDPVVAEDAGELGRRVRAWVAAVGELPAGGAALSGAAVLDSIMRARVARRAGGAVVKDPAVLPEGVWPQLRVQPEWVVDTVRAEKAFTHAEQLVRLDQEMGLLASAGMVTLGYGPARRLSGADAAAAAADPKRAFGLWRVVLPAADQVGLSDRLPAPHPLMSGGEPTTGVWVSSEDLAALGRDPRDGGAGLSPAQLGVDEAIVWAQQGRVLEGWATRLRQARETDDPVLRRLVDIAANAYLAALGDPQMWADPAVRQHFQPVWAASLVAHTRARGRRVATRIGREFHVWPLYARDTTTVYALGADPATGLPLDISDTHTRLGRLVTTARVELSNDTILAALIAETPEQMAHALLTPLGGAAQPGDATAPDNTEAADQAAQHDQPAALPAAAVDAPARLPEDTAAEGADPRTVPKGRPRQAAKAKPKTSTDRAPAAGSSGIAAAVLHTDGLWLPDGTRIDIAEPITHAGQIADWALRLAQTHQLGYRLSPNYAEAPQIWMTADFCESVGIDIDAIEKYKPAESLRASTEGIDFVTLAAASGWRFGGVADGQAPRLGLWTRLYRGEDKRGVLLGVIAGMGIKDEKDMPVIFIGEQTAGGLARRLQLFAEAMRYPWTISAGTTGFGMILNSRPRTYTFEEWKSRVFAPSTAEVPYGLTDIETDFYWTRKPDAAEQRCRFVHAYDRGASYPSAIAGLELAIGQPVHHPEPVPFDPKTPGYWLVEVPDPDEWRMPYVLNPRGLKIHEPKWVTTPRLERALALGYQPVILEALIWPEHGRILNGWYERIRDAAASLDASDPDQQAALKQSKVVRNATIGLMGSEPNLKGKTGYSPERRFHIMAKANANLIYAVAGIGQRTGRWPVVVHTDTILYISDDPDPHTAWPGDPKKFGTGFGQYKWDGSALLADHLPYLDGGEYRGKDKLLEPDDWRQLVAELNTGGH